MLDRLLSVGPPQKGISEEKTDVKMNLSDFQNHKSSFEEALKQKQMPGAKQAEKNEKENQKELKADSKIKKPSGGNKKKMVKSEGKNEKPEESEEEKLNTVDPKMISASMASNENDPEIAEDEELLAQVENQQEVAGKYVADLKTLDQLQSLLSEGEQDATAQQFEAAQQEAIAESVEVDNQQAVADQVEFSDFQKKIQESLEQDMKAQQLEKSLKAAIKQDDTDRIAEKLKQEVSALASTAQGQKSNNESQQESLEQKQDSLLNDFDLASTHHAGQSTEGFKSQLNDKVSTASTNEIKSNQNAQEVDGDVKTLLHQAKYLVTQGGGEVTVHMKSSEGQADVQLKVMLENGKINLELNTQDKSIKKMIEDSLSDLKSSLASHQMSLEHVKINNVFATNTDTSAQFNSQQQQSDSQQSKFFQQMDQFQQHSQKQKDLSREFFSDSRKITEPINLAVARQTAGAKSYGLKRGNTLNAVA